MIVFATGKYADHNLCNRFHFFGLGKNIRIRMTDERKMVKED
jgi:hypothetical protein